MSNVRFDQHPPARIPTSGEILAGLDRLEKSTAPIGTARAFAAVAERELNQLDYITVPGWVVAPGTALRRLRRKLKKAVTIGVLGRDLALSRAARRAARRTPRPVQIGKATW